MDWLLSLPFSLNSDHFANFFVKFWNFELWMTLILANLGFFLLILIPGIGLSYYLQGRLSASLRVSFGLSLGFIFPVLIFYVLGLSHLYYKTAWVICGILLSGFFMWRFRADFLREWKSSETTKSTKVFYGILLMFFLAMYIAFFKEGVMDYDILFGQVAPAVHLFFEHVYNPFDMGAIPIVRHELFPGPISFHSVFMMFGSTPWVAVTAVMVVLAPLMLRMFGQFSEFLMSRSEFFTVFMMLVTFLGFRIKNGRGTVLALIFLFGFLLLPRIFKELNEKRDAKFKDLLKPIISTAILVALSLYTNIEIGAILLGILAIAVVGSWLSGRRAMMKTLLFGLAGAFVIFAPWFLTVALLAFGNSLVLIIAFYLGLALLALVLTFLPKLKVDENLFQKIMLIFLVIGTAIAVYIGVWSDLFRLPDTLKYLSAASVIPILYFAWTRPDLDRYSMFLYSWFFGILFVDIYPLLLPAAQQIGLPEKLQFFLFDKVLGSVFPELRTKMNEYFFPLMSLIFLSGVLVWIVKNWLWQKWVLIVSVLIFFFFSCVRFQASDYEEYPRGQTISSMIYFTLSSEIAFHEKPVWLSQQAEEIMNVLYDVKKPGDKIFNFYAIHNPYFPEYIYPYLMAGVGSVGLNKEDLKSELYDLPLLDQVIAAGANYAIFMPGPVSPEIWLNDPRVNVVAKSDDNTYLLATLQKD